MDAMQPRCSYVHENERGLHWEQQFSDALRRISCTQSAAIVEIVNGGSGDELSRSVGWGTTRRGEDGSTICLWVTYRHEWIAGVYIKWRGLTHGVYGAFVHLYAVQVRQ